jgi:hypothetical protein
MDYLDNSWKKAGKHRGKPWKTTGKTLKTFWAATGKTRKLMETKHVFANKDEQTPWRCFFLDS